MIAQQESPPTLKVDPRLRALLVTVRRALLMIVKGLDTYLAD